MSTLWVRIKALVSGSGQHEVVHEITIEQQATAQGGETEQQEVAQEAKTEQQAAAQEAKSESQDAAQKTGADRTERKVGARKSFWCNWIHSKENVSDRLFRYAESFLKADVVAISAIFAWLFTSTITNELHYWTAWGVGIGAIVVALALIFIMALLVNKDSKLE